MSNSNRTGALSFSLYIHQRFCAIDRSSRCCVPFDTIPDRKRSNNNFPMYSSQVVSLLFVLARGVLLFALVLLYGKAVHHHVASLRATTFNSILHPCGTVPSRRILSLLCFVCGRCDGVYERVGALLCERDSKKI